MSRKSRERREAFIAREPLPEEMKIAITAAGETEYVWINRKQPAAAVVFSYPDAPEIVRANAALHGAIKALEKVSEDEREQLLVKFGLAEDVPEDEDEDEDALSLTLPTGQEIFFTKSVLEQSPKEFYRYLGTLLLEMSKDD